MNISKKAWNEILHILIKYKIPYTTSYVDRDNATDKHIQINLVIPDYFNDLYNSKG